MSFETRLAFGKHSCCQQMSTSTCGGPSPFCTGMWTRKASAGQDMVPGCSLCWAIQLWLFLPAEGYYFALLCEREVCVHLTGSTCVSPCYFQHCSIFMSGKKKKKRHFLSCSLMNKAAGKTSVCLKGYALGWAPICSDGPLHWNRVLSYKPKS